MWPVASRSASIPDHEAISICRVVASAPEQRLGAAVAQSAGHCVTGLVRATPRGVASDAQGPGCTGVAGPTPGHGHARSQSPFIGTGASRPAPATAPAAPSATARAFLSAGTTVFFTGSRLEQVDQSGRGMCCRHGFHRRFCAAGAASCSAKRGSAVGQRGG